MKPGPGSMRGLEWLVRVGPSPIEAWAVAMGWRRRAAYSHAERLVQAGLISRVHAVASHQSLLLATGRAVRLTSLEAARARPPAVIWWAHTQACAWTAAWLTARDRDMQGVQEVAADDAWSGAIRWKDRRGSHQESHRPDLAWLTTGRRVAIEVELARKSTNRLNAILSLHSRWHRDGHTAGVIYICGDRRTEERLRAVGADHGLTTEPGGGLRTELLSQIQEQALSSQTAQPEVKVGQCV